MRSCQLLQWALTALLLLDLGSGWQCSQSGSQAAGTCMVHGLVKLEPKHEVIEGTEVVWQKPPGSDKPKGVLLTFHGCSHGAVDWFPKAEGCQQCIGLPEEVAISSTALSRGYVLLALSSRDRTHSCCWAVPHHTDTHSIDTRSVSAVLGVLLPREGLTGLALYALGASSGGAFVLTLPTFIPLAGVCSQIMALPPDWYEAFLTQQQQQGPPPPPSNGAFSDANAKAAAAAGGAGGAVAGMPVLFVHMPRDEHTAALVAADVALRKKLSLASHVLEVQPQPVTAAFLSARVPELAAPGTAQQLVDLFKQQGLLDKQSGLLLRDPRGADWRQVVASSSIPGAAQWKLAPDESALSEVLNVAWAAHEIISDTTAVMLDWFEQQQQASLD